jgi:hypothetical protein
MAGEQVRTDPHVAAILGGLEVSRLEPAELHQPSAVRQVQVDLDERFQRLVGSGSVLRAEGHRQFGAVVE